MTGYNALWDKQAAKDTADHVKSRVENYTELVNGYYDGATELYEYGWADSFHFCRFYKGEAFLQALARQEHYLASQIGIKPGMKVLDVGCGVGGPAREIARFTDATIIGVNNNDFQIDRATQKTAKAGLSDRVSFQKADFMKLSETFGENQFDAIYAIEATCHAPVLEDIYREVYKCLKPGGVFGFYEWNMTDKWDASIPWHKEVAHGVEIGCGIASLRPIAEARQALKNVGFEILVDDDLADRDDPVQWYYPLEGNIWKAQTVWDMFTVARMSYIGKNISSTAIWCMEKLRMMPAGTYDVTEHMKTSQDALVKGGQTKLFTPMMLFVAKKAE